MNILTRIKTSIMYRLRLPFMSICKYLPVERNKIIFNCYEGMAYADSQKYIAEEILKQNLPFRLLWLVRNESVTIPPQIEKVKIGTYREIYELSTSRIIINNKKKLLAFKKSKSQYYIQTWHAGFSVKLLENDAKNKLPKWYVDQSMKESEITDLYVSNSKLQTQDFLQAFWYCGEILECGYPRNDIYFNSTDEDKKRIRKEIGISMDSTFLLYAPTFRDNGDIDCYDINFNLLQETLTNAGYPNPIIGVRLHPNIAYTKQMKYNDLVLDLSLYPDMQELLLVADILITDYSTTMFEFPIMKKKVFLYSPDIKEYSAMRGLKPIYSDLPFPLAQNQEDLFNNILTLDNEVYEKNVSDFMANEYIIFDNGNGAKDIVSKMKLIIGL